MFSSRLAILLLLGLSLIACGQKGDLYLPDNAEAPKTSVKSDQAVNAEIKKKKVKDEQEREIK